MTFNGEYVNFDGARFVGPAIFRGASFKADTLTSFRGTTFEAAADFGSSYFGAEAMFSGSALLGLVDFGLTVLLAGEAHFENCKFDGVSVAFDGLNLPNGGGMINFSGTRFESGEVSFSHLSISVEEFYFFDAKFEGPSLSFDNSTIHAKHLAFDRTSFRSEYTGFQYAQLSGWYTSFEHCEFGGELVTFNAADFSRADEDLNFDHASFTVRVADFGST